MEVYSRAFEIASSSSWRDSRNRHLVKLKRNFDYSHGSAEITAWYEIKFQVFISALEGQYL